MCACGAVDASVSVLQERRVVRRGRPDQRRPDQLSCVCLSLCWLCGCGLMCSNVLGYYIKGCDFGRPDRRSTACAMAHAESSRVRSGIAARATAVHARCPRVLSEHLERSESRLRRWDRRTADQGHRGRCPADLSRPWSRPWGRSRSAWGALN